MHTTGLRQTSPCYFDQTQIYEEFSAAEDAPNLVAEFLQPHVSQLSVLDVGCGTGKYLEQLAAMTLHYTGIDRSTHVLQRAQRKQRSASRVTLLQASAEALPFEASSFDVTFSCWVLGTILNDGQRKQALSECIRVTKDTGRIFAIENDTGGEFEYIRGRFPNSERTQSYNTFLEERSFIPLQRVESYFLFPSVEKARFIFGSIWGEEAANRIRSARIEHNIIIYQYQKSF
jgi:ubiquinone/menaquinone biosynthesis C-methylase UbiE